MSISHRLCYGAMKKYLTLLVYLVTLLNTPSTRATNLRVAVASNFAPTLQLIARRFSQTFHQPVDIIRGSTGKFYAQIKQGAPFDIFMAADEERPRLLEQQALIVPESRYTYATGKLVLWSPKHSNPLEKLKSGDFSKLAIANPAIAPYGRASLEVLRYLKCYEQAKDKLVYGENVAQAYQFVKSGNAELGFIPLSYVNAETSIFWSPMEGSYQPLDQQLVILKSSTQLSFARQFVDFLKRPEIRSFIRSRGYALQ